MTEKIINPKAKAVITSTHFCARVSRTGVADCAAVASAGEGAASASASSSGPTSDADGSRRTRAA